MGKSKISSKILFSNVPQHELNELLKDYHPKKIYLVTEEHVNNLWGPAFLDSLNDYNIKKHVISSGEENKKIDSVAEIWSFLSNSGADRKSVLINFGGGM